MKVNFYMPLVYIGITGGYKVVFQYANYLAEKGHDVEIYYTMRNGENSRHLPKFVGRFIWRILFIGYPRWYKLNNNITQKLVRNYEEKYIRDADASIATAFSTANPISKLSNKKGKKFYFIQDYENWGKTTDELVMKSYSLGMNNIVISKWLKEIVDKYSKEKSQLIVNGIDLNIFKIKNPIKNRNPYSISMLYSNTDKRKGSEYGIKVLKELKEKYPNLKVTLFSTSKRPKDLPNWIEYIHKANEEQVVDLMNNSAIYMCTSLVEGFGLPGLEAMACGCALVTTNCLGVMEYANENNAMISKPKDTDEMYKSIDKLLSDNDLRISIAEKGYVSIQNRDLTASKINFEKYITTI